jgi:hypothetical protein
MARDFRRDARQPIARFNASGSMSIFIFVRAFSMYVW